MENISTLCSTECRQREYCCEWSVHKAAGASTAQAALRVQGPRTQGPMPLTLVSSASSSSSVMAALFSRIKSGLAQ